MKILERKELSVVGTCSHCEKKLSNSEKKSRVMEAVDIVKLSVDRNGHQTVHFSDKCHVVSIEPASSRTILIKIK